MGLSRQAVDDLNCHRRLIAVSQATGGEFHVGQGVDGDQCVVVNNGIDLTVFRPRSASGKLHDELNLSDAMLVATIGQIGLRKGTEVALAAARRVLGELPNVHWVVVGERTSDKLELREFEARLREMASEPPLVGRVHFLVRVEICRNFSPNVSL